MCFSSSKKKLPMDKLEILMVWRVLYSNVPSKKERTYGSSSCRSYEVKKGESLRIYTDGEKKYVDRFEEPTL
jgi:hypothetical protein